MTTAEALVLLGDAAAKHKSGKINLRTLRRELQGLEAATEGQSTTPPEVWLVELGCSIIKMLEGYDIEQVETALTTRRGRRGRQ